MTTFTVTITGHPAPDPADLESNLTYVHPEWSVHVVEVDPEAMWEARARQLYAATPARSPISRKPLSYDVAARHGTRAAFRAQQQASTELGIAVIPMTPTRSR